MRRSPGTLPLALVCAAVLALPHTALPGQSADLTALSLEDLMDIEVTSVSKKAEHLSDASAAVFVITRDDLRRSGATSIPEALRMVPGIQVGRLDANKWAISARGFNGRFASKLLVLIDGRTVYTPLFSGVYWDAQDTLLEDVERIEVIRGPGATLWGANAVNGVINVITRSASDTRGSLLTVGAGTEERALLGVRQGIPLGPAGWLRVYAKAFDRDDGGDSRGHDASDEWQVLRSGFRSDWAPGPENAFTLSGDVYSGNAGVGAQVPLTTPPFHTVQPQSIDLSGANLLGRWQHTLSPTSDLSLQLYYDWTLRDEPTLATERRDTLDLDFQHRFSLGDRQELLWGFGYRRTRDEIRGGTLARVEESRRTDHLFSAFLQDQIHLLPDLLDLTVGSKFEHNDYTAFEVQPSARAVWTPSPRHSIWASVSRAVRTPSRGERDGMVDLLILPPGDPNNPGPLPVSLVLNESDDLVSETVVSYELGYRVQALENLSLDMAAFLSVYDDLRALASADLPILEGSPFPTHVVQPVNLGNRMSGTSRGVELAADWRATGWWRLLLAYSYLKLDLKTQDALLNEEAAFEEGRAPKHQLSLRSQTDLGDALELDLWLRFVDDLPSQDDPEVDAYLTLDVRVGWRPVPELELSLVGQSLLEGRHLEGVPEAGVGSTQTEVQRGVYGKVTWEF